MTDLPIEPLVYTKEEFEEVNHPRLETGGFRYPYTPWRFMKKSNPFIKDILRNAKKLA